MYGKFSQRPNITSAGSARTNRTAAQQRPAGASCRMNAKASPGSFLKRSHFVPKPPVTVPKPPASTRPVRPSGGKMAAALNQRTKLRDQLLAQAKARRQAQGPSVLTPHPSQPCPAPDIASPPTTSTATGGGGRKRKYDAEGGVARAEAVSYTHLTLPTIPLV